MLHNILLQVNDISKNIMNSMTELYSEINTEESEIKDDDDSSESIKGKIIDKEEPIIIEEETKKKEEKKEKKRKRKEKKRKIIDLIEEPNKNLGPPKLRAKKVNFKEEIKISPEIMIEESSKTNEDIEITQEVEINQDTDEDVDIQKEEIIIKEEIKKELKNDKHKKKESDKKKEIPKIGLIKNEKKLHKKKQSKEKIKHLIGKKDKTEILVKKRRSKPGIAALRQIKKLQKTVDHLIPKLSFSRFVREITQNIVGDDMRFTVSALDAIQEAAEAHLTTTFENSYKLSMHRKRITLMPSDIRLYMEFKQSKK